MRPHEGDIITIESMDDLTPQAPDHVTLYRRAFAKYASHALWNKRRLEEPTLHDALVIARALRVEGDLQARRLAEEIEKSCRAAL